MSASVVSFQAKAYSISTTIFEGPLDLLLQLIERAELDITKLALAQVTDQYLEHINSLDAKAVEEVSAFIVIATRLIQIKSEALLPRPPAREPGEEDPADALARQLVIYRQYKRIAAFLAGREASKLRTHLRLAPLPRIEGRLDLSEVGIDELVFAARRSFQGKEGLPPLSSVVTRPRFTIRDKIGTLVRELRQRGQTTFRNLFSRAASRLEVVVTFLALLELVKRHVVNVKQDNLFEDIDIHLPEDNRELMNQEFDLEFGE